MHILVIIMTALLMPAGLIGAVAPVLPGPLLVLTGKAGITVVMIAVFVLQLF